MQSHLRWSWNGLVFFHLKHSWKGIPHFRFYICPTNKTSLQLCFLSKKKIPHWLNEIHLWCLLQKEQDSDGVFKANIWQAAGTYVACCFSFAWPPVLNSLDQLYYFCSMLVTCFLMQRLGSWSADRDPCNILLRSYWLFKEPWSYSSWSTMKSDWSIGLGQRRLRFKFTHSYSNLWANFKLVTFIHNLPYMVVGKIKWREDSLMNYLSFGRNTQHK